MKKKLTIHIGTHKTGTSSLQKLTSNLAEELLNEGIVVVDYLQIPNRNEFSKTKAVNEALIKGLHKFLKNETKAPKENFLLIWEGFSGDPRQNYENRNAVQEMLFRSLPEGLDVELVVFFRRQDQFIQSIYTQYKHEKDFSLGEELLKPHYHEGYDWNLYIKDLESIFEGVSINAYPYERIYLAANPLHQILGDLLESQVLRTWKVSEIVNVGMNPKALDLFERLAPKLNKQESKYLRKVLQTKFNKGLLSEYEYLSTEDQKEWINLYKESNVGLASKYSDGRIDKHEFDSEMDAQAQKFENVEEDLIVHLIQEIEKFRLKKTISSFDRIKQKIKQLIA